MFCPNCGKKIPDNSKFCEYCGERMDEQGQFEKQSVRSGMPAGFQGHSKSRKGSQPRGKSRGQSNHSRNTGLFAAVGVIVVLFAVLVVLVGLIFGRKPDKSVVPDSSTASISEKKEEVTEDKKEEVIEDKKDSSDGQEEIKEPVQVSLATLNGRELDGDAKNYADQISQVNQGSGSLTQISIYEKNYTPAERDTSYTWDKTLFYTLEDISPSSYQDGQINSYWVERKQLQNEDSGNLIDYEIYRNPSNNAVNKIVSIEYVNNEILVTDYYYEDNGKVSFIFQRMESSYVPSYAVPTTSGERYYFHKDVMVKWRIVSGGSQTNYCVGKNESKASNNTGTIKIYKNLSDDEKSKFKKTEKNMINAAYNTYNIVLGAAAYQSIYGYVADESGALMANVRGFLYSQTYQSWVYDFYTDEEGKYNIIIPDEAEFNIYFHNNGYKDINIFNISTNREQVTSYMETAYLIRDEAGECSAQFVLIDAFTEVSDGYMLRIGDALLNFRYGLGNRTGEIIQTVRTDANGQARVTLMPGCYTVEIQKSGYINSYCTCVVLADSSEIELNTSPVLNTDEVRIVLTWGATPSDLDSHLFTPYDTASQDTTYHIWYGNRYDAMYNNLDVDDTTSYGPETMTINNLTNGLYKYYVADFSNCVTGNPQSYEMSYSNAKVSVFTSEGLVRQFSVPVGQSGVIWEVFEIRNKQIVPIQRYYNNIDNISFWSSEK